MNYNWFSVSDQDVQKYEQICPAGEYRVIRPDQLPGPLPQALINKYDSVLVIASGSQDSGVTCYMINGHRVDAKTSEVDQQPFGFVCSGSQAMTNGCLIQHGDWDNRTISPPQEFWSYLSGSGIGNCYPLPELPQPYAGKIKDLQVTSQHEAFNSLLAEIRRSFTTIDV